MMQTSLSYLRGMGGVISLECKDGYFLESPREVLPHVIQLLQESRIERSTGDGTADAPFSVNRITQRCFALNGAFLVWQDLARF